MKKKTEKVKDDSLFEMCYNHELKREAASMYHSDKACPFCLGEKVDILESYIRKLIKEQKGEKDHDSFDVW